MTSANNFNQQIAAKQVKCQEILPQSRRWILEQPDLPIQNGVKCSTVVLELPVRTAFDGATYDPERDYERLTGQLKRVFDFAKDGNWHTIPDIVEVAGGSPQAVSARLRDLRKRKYGSHAVERRYVSEGLFEYRLVLRRAP